MSGTQLRNNPFFAPQRDYVQQADQMARVNMKNNTLLDLEKLYNFNNGLLPQLQD